MIRRLCPLHVFRMNEGVIFALHDRDRNGTLFCTERVFA